MFRTLLCAVATIFTCGAGMASAVTFDFSGGGTNGKTLTFNEGGLTLFAETNGERIIHANNGLGVRGPSNGPEFDNALITLGETLTFRLEPRPIKSLISVVFEGGLDAERIDFLVGGITLEQLILPRAPQRSNVTFDLSSLLPLGNDRVLLRRRRGKGSRPRRADIVPRDCSRAGSGSDPVPRHGSGSSRRVRRPPPRIDPQTFARQGGCIKNSTPVPFRQM